jgi:hypothetical protein
LPINSYKELFLIHQYVNIPCEEKEPKEEPDPTEPKKKKDGKPAETLSRFFD